MALSASIASQDALCYIDFEFVLPYFEELMSASLLQESIANATNLEVANRSSGDAHASATTLTTEDTNIAELIQKPSESSPRFIKVVGWISCKDRQRQVYLSALEAAAKHKRISKQLAEHSGLSKTKVSVSQFMSRFSNSEHVNKPVIDSKPKFDEFMKQRSNQTAQGQSVNDEENLNEDGDDGAEQAQPLATLPNFTDGQSFVVNEHIAHQETVEVPDNTEQQQPTQNGDSHDDSEYVDVATSSNNNTQDFHMVEAEAEIDQQSPKDNEQEEVDDHNKLTVDATSADDASMSVESLHDYSNITPTVPSMPSLAVSPLNIAKSGSPGGGSSPGDTEVTRLKKELADLKYTHEKEMVSFTSTLQRLKKEQYRKTSMQIDDEIISKEVAKEKNDKVQELEQQLLAKQNQESAEMQQLKLKYNNDLQKFQYQLRQTEQLHVLEVKNIRSKHQYEKDENQRQIRAFHDALQLQSEKEKKIALLSDENEQLKADKERIVTNYEQAISRMNEQTEANIQERVKRMGALNREITELRASLKRQTTKTQQLETQCEHYTTQIDDKNRFIAQLQSMYDKEKSKSNRLQKKIYKSKRNALAQDDDDKESVKTKKIIESGGHVRKLSKGLKGRVTTQYKLDTGETVVEIEKQKDFDMNDIMAQDPHLFGGGGDEDDPDLDHSDSDFEDDKDKKTITEEAHNQEIALKKQEIVSLKEKISNLQTNLESFKQSSTEELQAAQQKIGSLQQQLQQEQDHYLKQYEMFDFKLKNKEGALKTAEQQLADLRQSHKKQVRTFNREIEELKQECIDKDGSIMSLEQHVDMLQEENGRLKEFEQDIADYEQDIEELDNHYQSMLDEIKEQNDEQQTQLRSYAQEKEQENLSLQNTVHAHRNTITNLEQTLSRMKQAESTIMDKEKELEHIIQLQQEQLSSTPPAAIRNSRASRELDGDAVKQAIEFTEQSEAKENDSPQRRDSVALGPVLDNDDNNIDTVSASAAAADDHNTEWHGETQAEPQPDHESETFDLSASEVDLSGYVARQELEEVRRQMQRVQEEGALRADTLRDAQQKLRDTQERFTTETQQLRDEKTQLQQELRQNRDLMDTQTKNAERERITLLTNFMSEMDRMREEIRKLNQSRRNQGNANGSKSAFNLR